MRLICEIREIRLISGSEPQISTDYADCTDFLSHLHGLWLRKDYPKAPGSYPFLANNPLGLIREIREIRGSEPLISTDYADCTDFLSHLHGLWLREDYPETPGRNPFLAHNPLRLIRVIRVIRLISGSEPLITNDYADCTDFFRYTG